MIYSMTAFARHEIRNEHYQLVCELRSINHRFLELSFYLSEALRPLEGDLREKIRSLLKRGKIDCAMRYQPKEMNELGGVQINLQRAKSLCNAALEINQLFATPSTIVATDILRMPGVIENEEMNVEHIKDDVLQLLETTLKELQHARAREGEALAQLLIERMGLLEQQIEKIKQKLPEIINEQQSRLRKRFEEAQVELDPTRLETEMVLFAQRLDISEELDRLVTHIQEVRRTLKTGGPVGRRLDFLMQELNREANTIGSKSVDMTTSHAAVEMKVIIEQAREQVQNIE